MPEIAYNNPVPTDVLESAVRVKAWFDELGLESWEFLGICSRDHADKLREIRARIQHQLKISRHPDDKPVAAAIATTEPVTRQATGVGGAL